MLPAINKLADRLISLSALLGSIGLIVEVVVILVDVTGRYFGSPLTGAQDISQMAMVIVVFGGMALCDRMGGHVAVDIFERYFPRGFNRAVDILSALIGAVIFLALAWAVYESAKLSVMLNLSTNLLNLPKVWFQWALCGFAVVTALGMTLRAAELALSGRDVRGTARQ
mgnify:CR=1 FL=1